MSSTAARNLPPPMTVEEFLRLPGDGTGTIYELVDGELRAQDAASDAHGTIQTRLAALLTNHIDAKRPGCRVVTTPGIQPRIRADWNYRVPELGVTCSPNRADGHMTPDPILLVEILSPSNEKQTWSNVPLYASLPSVTEILIVASTAVAAQILRRNPDGSWPRNPQSIAPGATVELTSIGLTFPLSEVYRDTHLAT